MSTRCMKHGALALLCVAAVAGCTSQTTAGPAMIAATNAVIGVQKPLADYLLTQSDVPAGFVMQAIPGADDPLNGQVIESTKRATVKPASCQQDLSELSNEDAANTPKALFVNGSTGTSVINSVNPASNGVGNTVEGFRRYNLGDCANYELTSSVNGQTFTVQQQTREVDIAVPGVTGALTVEQQALSQVPGVGLRSTKQYLALIPVPGGLVTPTVGDILRRTTPNQDVFRQVIAADARKIAG